MILRIIATVAPVITARLTAQTAARGAESYAGAYTVTPSQTAQVLETAGLLMTDNVTVNPIPQNYGLITYDGYGITVS